MASPWEKYGAPDSGAAPWEKYGAPPPAAPDAAPNAGLAGPARPAAVQMQESPMSSIEQAGASVADVGKHIYDISAPGIATELYKNLKGQPNQAAEIPAKIVGSGPAKMIHDLPSQVYDVSTPGMAREIYKQQTGQPNQAAAIPAKIAANALPMMLGDEFPTPIGDSISTTEPAPASPRALEGRTGIEQPASPVQPPKQLGGQVLEGEYLDTPPPVTPIRGELKRGTYEQPGDYRQSPMQPQLPAKAAPIALPESFPTVKPVVSEPVAPAAAAADPLADFWAKTKSVGGNQSGEFARIKAELFPGKTELTNPEIEQINDRMNAPKAEPAAAAPIGTDTNAPPPIGSTIPRTLAGDSALRQVLTGQDNANLLKIAKSRGINVTKEAQLKAGVADNLLINKIINDFSPDELQNARDTFLESRRNMHQFGEIGPEAWKTMGVQTFFPDVKIPAAALKRTQAAIASNEPVVTPGETPVPKKPAAAAGEDDLTDQLQQSLDQVKAQKAGEGEQGRPFADPQSSTTYGKQNQGVSAEDAQAARESLRNKLFRSHLGLDPTMLADAAKIGAYHVEAGLREFGAWSQKMVEDVGEEIRPHLRWLWDEANDSPGTNAPTFYSKAAKVIDAKVGGSAPGDSILATLRNAGVKESEIQWTGLDDYLAGKPKVSKADLQKFINDSQIQLEETVKTKNQIPALEWSPTKTGTGRQAWFTRTADGSAKIILKDGRYDLYVYDDDGNSIYAQEADSFEEAQRDVASTIAARTKGAPRHENYTLPGEKSNYTEMLLQLPEKGAARLDQVNDRLAEISEMPAKVHKGEGGKALLDEWDTLKAEQKQLRLEMSKPYKAPEHHFTEPNILAHVRFDDRTAADGAKTLFIEETQSDWNQEGRHDGYRPAATEKSEIERQLKEAEAEHSKTADARHDTMERWKYGGISGNEKATVGDVEAADEANVIAAEKVKALRRKLYDGVPDNPYKSDWHELAMKRMLRHAAENGYDRMAWVTGEQTADRYNLSKHLDELHYTYYEKGDGEPEQYGIAGFKDGEGVFSKVVPAKDLPELVGKDVADRMSKGQGDELVEPGVTGVTRPTKVLSGVDLDVGGNWAKALYDRAIPNFLNKYAKKWGAKVGETEIGAKAPTIDDLKEIHQASRGTLHTAVNNVISEMQDGKSFADAMDLYGTDQLREAMKRKKLDAIGPTKVHSIDITPAMKKSVLKEGQPIARNEDLAPAELATA